MHVVVAEAAKRFPPSTVAIGGPGGTSRVGSTLTIFPFSIRIDIAGRSLPSPGSTIVRLLIRSGPAISISCRAGSLVRPMIDDVSKVSIAKRRRDIVQHLAAAARISNQRSSDASSIFRALVRFASTGAPAHDSSVVTRVPVSIG